MIRRDLEGAILRRIVHGHASRQAFEAAHASDMLKVSGVIR